MNQPAADSDPHSSRRPYGVVQWATGNVGAHALRSIIQHPQMTLAGVYVTSESDLRSCR